MRFVLDTVKVLIKMKLNFICLFIGALLATIDAYPLGFQGPVTSESIYGIPGLFYNPLGFLYDLRPPGSGGFPPIIPPGSLPPWLPMPPRPPPPPPPPPPSTLPGVFGPPGIVFPPGVFGPPGINFPPGFSAPNEPQSWFRQPGYQNTGSYYAPFNGFSKKRK